MGPVTGLATGDGPGVQLRTNACGNLDVGRMPDLWALSAPLALAGGVLVVDPFAPHEAPTAWVSDMEEAEGWFAAVYGADAAEAARGLAARGEPGRDVATPWQPGEFHVPFARLALAVWLERWSPRPLDRGLLNLEIGTLLWQLLDLVPAAEETGRERLGLAAERLDRLLAHTDLLESHGRRLRPVELMVVDRLADAAVAADELLVGHPLHPTFEARARRSAQQATDGLRLLRALSGEELLTRVEGPSHGPGTRRASVDWAQVPPALLPSEEGAVSWTCTPVPDAPEAAELSVTVPVLANAEPGAHLAFRVYAPGEPLPVAMASLNATGERRLGGTVRLARSAAADPDSLTVDVYDVRLVGPPRTGRAAAYAAAERDAVRNLDRLRLVWGGRLPGHPQDMAAWSDRSHRTAADLARHAPASPDPLAERLAGLATLPAARVAAPDWPLSHPAWLPTVAEWSAADPTLLIGLLSQH
jgi:hypothetical protein